MKTALCLGAVEVTPDAFEHHANTVRRLAKPGDLLTHSRCMGAIEEHLLLEFSGPWILGKATPTTRKFGGVDTDDIHPGNVTHINRVFVPSLEVLRGEAGISRGSVPQEAR